MAHGGGGMWPQLSNNKRGCLLSCFSTGHVFLFTVYLWTKEQPYSHQMLKAAKGALSVTAKTIRNTCMHFKFSGLSVMCWNLVSKIAVHWCTWLVFKFSIFVGIQCEWNSCLTARKNYANIAHSFVTEKKAQMYLFSSCHWCWDREQWKLLMVWGSTTLVCGIIFHK